MILFSFYSEVTKGWNLVKRHEDFIGGFLPRGMVHGKLVRTLLELHGIFSCLKAANAQESAVTIQIKLITSMVNVSSEQYQRAMDYINEYHEANRRLSEVTGFLTTNLTGVLDMTVVRSFLAEIQSHLTNNVQQLIVNYSPENIRAFIFSYFTTFTTNIVVNTGAFNELNELTGLYMSKFLNPNSTDCMSKHAEDILEIYSNAASGFIKVMEEDVATTVSQLEIYRAEIIATVAELTNKLQEISSNRATALVRFGEFVSLSSLNYFEAILS